MSCRSYKDYIWHLKANLIKFVREVGGDNLGDFTEALSTGRTVPYSEMENLNC